MSPQRILTKKEKLTTYLKKSEDCRGNEENHRNGDPEVLEIKIYN